MPPAHSVQRILHGFVDYAGLFPPAGLDLETAWANYIGYLGSEDRWMLGRFVIAAEQLEDLSRFLTGVTGEAFPQPVPLSVLCGTAPAEVLEAIRGFEETIGSVAEIVSLEGSAESGAEIESLAERVPPSLPLYVEIPWTADLEALLLAVSRAGVYAKVRAGGVVGDRFPPTDTLLRFLVAAIGARQPFKATAGLHHPVRGQYPLTYEAGSDSAVMHGYLNLLAAVAALIQGGSVGLASRLLEVTDPAAVRWAADGLQVGGHRLDWAALERARGVGLHAVGSCSFREPLEELGAFL